MRSTGTAPNKEKVAPHTEIQQGFKSQQLTLIRDLILFDAFKILFLHAISSKVHTHSKYSLKILKN
jgi:hypothetical protein